MKRAKDTLMWRVNGVLIQGTAAAKRRAKDFLDRGLPAQMVPAEDRLEQIEQDIDDILGYIDDYWCWSPNALPSGWDEMRKEVVPALEKYATAYFESHPDKRYR